MPVIILCIILLLYTTPNAPRKASMKHLQLFFFTALFRRPQVYTVHQLQISEIDQNQDILPSGQDLAQIRK
jgi:hypothetical protein